MFQHLADTKNVIGVTDGNAGFYAVGAHDHRNPLSGLGCIGSLSFGD
jgi:hypothetical protein